MTQPPAGNLYRLHILGLLISLILAGTSALTYADNDIQFNTDVLDVVDRKNIDLSQFSRGSYIMPGRYSMVVRINEAELPEQLIPFYVPEDDVKGSRACVSKSLTEQLGLKADEMKSLNWWYQGECLDESSLKGMEMHGDLATQTLYLNIPQAYLDYTSDDWDPPSRWDDGVMGLLFDYNINAQTQHQQRDGTRSYSVSSNGTTGANLSSWRLRADWQGQTHHQTGSGLPTSNSLTWSRFFAYRAIPALRSKLTVGEDSLNSGIFDSFRFTGGSLVSDDNMLPPNLRGYAPEVVGVARTNARVTVSQQGRVLHEVLVASGPFRIQSLNSAVSGELNVRVEEQDGSVQEFTMNTANIPYLTRPGSLRFKLAAGQPTDVKHHGRGPLFGVGEFSWGVNSGWSLYGGGLIGGDYNALSLGLGRDLMMFGALSFDATQTQARLPQEDEALRGGSYRVSYSKTFNELDSQVTFAGYRFSEKDFMSMSEYLDARYYGNRVGNSKEMYTITFNKQFRDWGMSSYLNYSHQTYWDNPTNDRYSLTMSRSFDISNFKNLNVSLSAYRNRYNETNDDGMYLSLAIPWGNSTLSYNTTVNRNDNIHRVGYNDRIDEHNNYQLSVGSARSGVGLSGYFNHEGDVAQLSANASYQEGSYSAVGLSAQGGVTLTSEGGALHRIGTIGGTRMLLDTNGVKGVPVRGYGSTSRTNMFGKVVVADINSYYRNKASIDVNKLGDNVEASRSVVQATLTEGAIGYRTFDVITGEKAMAIISLADSSVPPFGATVINARKQETGIVNDGGSVYLSGITAGESMTVHWNGAPQCEVQLPSLSAVLTGNLLLPCKPISGNSRLLSDDGTSIANPAGHSQGNTGELL